MVQVRSPRTCALDRILRGGGGVGAAGGGPPSQDAWFALLQPPALGLLAPVVVAAQRREVALAGGPAEMPRRSVIQVTVRGRVPAARRGARGVAGSDQVAKFAAGPVAGLGLGVLAGPADDLVELQGAGVGGSFGVPAGRAGVRGGGPVRVQDGV